MKFVQKFDILCNIGGDIFFRKPLNSEHRSIIIIIVIVSLMLVIPVRFFLCSVLSISFLIFIWS